jgi:hypothetical protein
MQMSLVRRRARLAILSASAATALAAVMIAPTGVNATTLDAQQRIDKRAVVVTGLDNPRQLTILANGAILVAEAGHGGKHCVGHGQNAQCVGTTGKVTRIHHGHARHVMRGLLSGAGKDGSFAVGSDGAGKRSGGPFFAIETRFPPAQLPPGVPHWQNGRLLAKRPHGSIRPIANVGRFEVKHNPDGEEINPNPYSLLALKHQVLVSDAGGDYIARVRDNKVSLWAQLPTYGKKVDAVPTTISLGGDGNIYVGELHSEQPHQAKVWKYDRRGNVMRSWGGFTTITGVARGKDGSLYVSELFGGPCTFDDIPRCFPGRVVKVSPDGDRSYRRVPFPAGIDVQKGHVYVAAFSVSPANGFGGNPSWSGQIWRIFR